MQGVSLISHIFVIYLLFKHVQQTRVRAARDGAVTHTRPRYVSLIQQPCNAMNDRLIQYQWPPYGRQTAGRELAAHRCLSAHYCPSGGVCVSEVPTVALSQACYCAMCMATVPCVVATVPCIVATVSRVVATVSCVMATVPWLPQ